MKFYLHNKDLGLLILRVGIGILNIVTAYQQFTGAQALVSIGYSANFIYLWSLIELIGGIALLTGIQFRIAAWMLSLLGFFSLVTSGYIVGTVVIELGLITLAATIALALIGPGQYIWKIK